jgi:hypothetical protein
MHSVADLNGRLSRVSAPVPRRPGARRLSWWTIEFVVGVAIVLAYAMAPHSDIRNVLSVANGYVIAGAIILAARLHRPASSAPWLQIAIGTAFVATGTVLHSFLFGGWAAAPSLGHALLIAGYLVLVAAVLRPRSR